jgi:hypothetical protein
MEKKIGDLLKFEKLFAETVPKLEAANDKLMKDLKECQ